ncbi:hypothetical protein O181_030298 [Austropuccinia psidii MF-1]|uniref:Uncharacterized protein n=1 Tax=Austropuccinia psidii MF-1 TaxID=1389203 RepID=A0A9Q3H3K4_9BASI|nr:hypothetical protein [Austropuccinia psidii MF-1]
MTGTDIWGREGKNVLHQKCGIVLPYFIKNLTGYPLKVSVESEDKFHKGKEYLVEDVEIDRYYPKIALRWRPPIEIENLLPFDIKHYLLLLGVEFQDDGVVGLKRSEYSIVNTNHPEDFPVENWLILED